MTDSEFHGLELALLAMVDQLEKEYPKPATFDKVLAGIRIIRGDAMDEVKKLTELNHAKVRFDLDRLLNPAFNSERNASAALVRLVKNARYNFFIEKSYQVSKAHGIFDHHLQHQGTITDYYLLQLFADHFETLTQRLKCLLEDFHGLNDIPNETPDLYRLLKNKIPEAILNEWNIPTKVVRIRNAINHGSSIATAQGIKYIPKNSKHPKTIEWRECRKTIEFIIAYSILLSTEIDYRFFKLAKGKPELRNHFSMFFDLYKSSFFTKRNAS